MTERGVVPGRRELLGRNTGFFLSFACYNLQELSRPDHIPRVFRCPQSEIFRVFYGMFLWDVVLGAVSKSGVLTQKAEQVCNRNTVFFKKTPLVEAKTENPRFLFSTPLSGICSSFLEKTLFLKEAACF